MSDALACQVGALPHARLTEVEAQRLVGWAERSTLPAWRELNPALPATPPETIARLVAEWRAMREILELVGEFAGDLGQLLHRLHGTGS